jgi:hypothetical protein
VGILHLVISLLFVSAGAFLLWRGQDPAIAWIGILFFGGCAIVACWETWQSRIKKTRSLECFDTDGERRTLVVKSNVAHYVVFTMGGAGFTLAGGLMIATGNQPFVGWLTAGFFGPGTLLLFWQIIDQRPRLVIDSDGVIDRTLGIGRIVWADVEWAYLGSVHGNDFICLVLRDPSVYLQRVSWLRRNLMNANTALGFSELNLNLSGIAVNSEEVLRLVMWHILQQQEVENMPM